MSGAHLVDIGTNLTHRRFRADLDAVLTRARNAGVRAIVATGVSVAGSREALDLVRGSPWLRCTAGVHPHNARQWSDGSSAELARLASHAEVVAVGECGLDYDRDFSPRPVQRRAFEAQLRLGAELQKPVFLHERDAHDDFLAILREHRQELVGGVVHCFTGQARQLEAYLALDLHIGITGFICDDRRGTHLRDLVSIVPPDRLMVETDAPFLLPAGARPARPGRNEPGLLPLVLAEVARARGEEPGVVAAATTATARRFFGLPP